MQYSQLFLDFMVLGIDAVISHDFGMSSPEVQFIGGLG